jgi:hypothetical protein
MNRPVNTTYLVIGLVFLGLAGAWALRETGVMDPDDFRWLLPLVLVIAGGAGVVASVVKQLGSGRRSPEPADPADEPVPAYDRDEL